MNELERHYLERLEYLISKTFKGYCVDVSVCKDEQMNERVTVVITLIDATRFQLPSFELNEGNVDSLIECLEVNRNKIMMLQD